MIPKMADQVKELVVNTLILLSSLTAVFSLTVDKHLQCGAFKIES